VRVSFFVHAPVACSGFPPPGGKLHLTSAQHSRNVIGSSLRHQAAFRRKPKPCRRPDDFSPEADPFAHRLQRFLTGGLVRGSRPGRPLFLRSFACSRRPGHTGRHLHSSRGCRRGNLHRSRPSPLDRTRGKAKSARPASKRYHRSRERRGVGDTSRGGSGRYRSDCHRHSRDDRAAPPGFRLGRRKGCTHRWLPVLFLRNSAATRSGDANVKSAATSA
jgi:hypothetical protein